MAPTLFPLPPQNRPEAGRGRKRLRYVSAPPPKGCRHCEGQAVACSLAVLRRGVLQPLERAEYALEGAAVDHEHG